MARKPQNAKPRDQAMTAPGMADTRKLAAAPRHQAATEQDVAASSDTRRGSTDGTAANAPDHARVADEPGQAGGENGSGLPATLPDMAIQDAGLIVTCHREGGRRRAGRRWEHGDTTVCDGELTDYQLALLQGDPRFTVRKIGQE